MILNNGIEIPNLGLGTFRNKDENTADSIITAIDNGYRLIDTAKVYNNEEAIKQAIASTQVDRKQLHITSKVWTKQFTNIKQEVKRALAACGLEYFDTYMLHWPRSYAENALAWQQMEEIYDAGLVKSIGVCNFQIHHIDKLMETAKVTPVINQVECHPNLPQYHLQQVCDTYGIKLQSYCSLMQGESTEAVNQVAQKYGVKKEQIILKWLINRGILVIPKSANKERQIINFDAQKIELSDDDMLLIAKDNIAKRYYPDPDNHLF